MHGYFSLSANGDKNFYECSQLSQRCGREPVIDQYCPQTCNTCDKAGKGWKYPFLPRSIHFTPGEATENCQSVVTINGVTKTMAEFIQDFEDQKSQACASTLFQMKHKTPAFDEVFDIYFGDFTEDKFNQLLGVVTRVCTFDDYTYNCDPGFLDHQTNSCPLRMSSTEKNRVVKLGATELSDFPSDQYVRQSDLVKNGFQQHIIDCFNNPDIRCGYTSTLAFVKHLYVGNRNINLCPVSFWAQASKPYGALLAIVHELSHFKDIAEANHQYYSDRDQMGLNIYSTHAISLFIAGITNLNTMATAADWWTVNWEDFGMKILQPTASPTKQEPFVLCTEQRKEYKWEPMDNLPNEPMSIETSEAECASRCEFTEGCIGSTWEASGSCHLSGPGATLVKIEGESTSCTNEEDSESYCLQSYRGYMRYCDYFASRGYCASWTFMKDCCRSSCNICTPKPSNTGTIASVCTLAPTPTASPTFSNSLCGTIQVRGSVEAQKQYWSLGNYMYKCNGPHDGGYKEGFNNPQQCCFPQKDHELICSGSNGWKGGYLILTKANGETHEYCRDFLSGNQLKTMVNFP